MSEIKYNPQHKEIIDSFLLAVPGVSPGKMFGYPAYYINRRLFACLYEDGVGVKVPTKLADDLIGKEGIVHFQPMGKAKMKEWIQLNREKSADYLNDQGIFEESIRFVSSLGDKKK